MACRSAIRTISKASATRGSNARCLPRPEPPSAAGHADNVPDLSAVAPNRRLGAGLAQHGHAYDKPPIALPTGDVAPDQGTMVLVGGRYDARVQLLQLPAAPAVRQADRHHRRQRDRRHRGTIAQAGRHRLVAHLLQSRRRQIEVRAVEQHIGRDQHRGPTVQSDLRHVIADADGDLGRRQLPLLPEPTRDLVFLHFSRSARCFFQKASCCWACSGPAAPAET